MAQGKSHLSGLTEEEELIIIEGLEDKKPSKKEEKTEKKSKNNKKQEIIKEAVVNAKKSGELNKSFDQAYNGNDMGNVNILIKNG